MRRRASMIVCEDRPRHPPDRTVRLDRRSRHSAAAAPSGAAQKAHRCRVGVPGAGPGVAGRAQRASLAADVLRPAGTPVSLPAQAAWLSQAVDRGGAADLSDHAVPGHAVPWWADDLRLIDATPVPCGRSRETVQRSELAGWANYGYCAAHWRWYWGLKLYLITTTEGMPLAWCLADPKLGERDVAEELFGHARDHGALRDGMIVLADKGLSGKQLEHFAADQIGVLLARPDRTDEKRRHGNLTGMHQWIEAIYDTRKDQLNLEGHGT